MTRTQRIQPVQRLIDEREKDQAEALARARQRVTDAETKLAELARYRQDYEQSFQREAGAGASGLRLRDFRLFLARLDEARRQQELVIARLRSEVDGLLRQWQEAARRSRALGVVVDKWRGEERVALERREQRETDERASGMAARRMRGQG